MLMMMLMLVFILLLMMIPAMFILLNLTLAKKNMLNQEKSTPVECGFDPLSTNCLPFSIQFFMISMIFLIFDIEIVLLMPLIYIIQIPYTMMIMMSSIFLMILIIGLYFEFMYMSNSLEWKT